MAGSDSARTDNHGEHPARRRLPVALMVVQNWFSAAALTVVQAFGRLPAALMVVQNWFSAAALTVVQAFGRLPVALMVVQNWFSAAALTVVQAFRRLSGETWFSAIALVVSVLAYTLSFDTEQRQVSSDLLNRLDADQMWKARLTLEQYYYLVGDKLSADDIAAQTEKYFEHFVYRNDHGAMTPDLGAIKNVADNPQKQTEFFLQLDQSRLHAKNFYVDIMISNQRGLISTGLSKKVLTDRFYISAPEFLQCFWLPVQIGQALALTKKQDQQQRQQQREQEWAKQCEVIDWYHENSVPPTQPSCMKDRAIHAAFCPTSPD